ncbi:acyl--CoA ligase [Kutzneria viridogrisea]|uniref:Acyl-CoA synthetase (AMP-forming)/AMP-acid ligase II n=1 Tax=Kutzneria viridogrisea TaxID=47990 RepID=A0ABR6B958_9PSEU|nr:acyl-CoA synthetase (AMP-forming)/AMP-acid ligase II [Kutzneria viridogrisea]
MAKSDFDLAHQYRGTDARSPADPWRTAVAVLAAHARSRPDAPMLTAVAPDGAQTTLTYGVADLATRRLAAWLQAEFGTAPNTVLGLAPVNDVPSVLAVLAALRAGHGVLMLGPADPPERHAEQAAALGVRAVLRTPDGGTGTVVMPRWEDLPEAEPVDPRIDPMTDALFFGTSGSTAAAKLVAQTHGNLVANAAGLGRLHGLRPGDRVLGCLPIHHVNGLHFTVLGTMFAGAHTILAHSFTPFGYPALVRQFRPRIASVVPSVLEALVETWRAPSLPAEFDYFVSAAAPLQASTARAVADRLGARVLQGYGLSETTNFSATIPPNLSEDAYRALLLDTDIPSVGVAFPGNEIAVLDEHCAPVPAGQVGEVCMRGHNVMSRYAGNPQATAEAFQGGWFHSQDLGFLRHDERSGRDFLVLTGRLKNIAKVAGETVSLEEMDRVLRALPEVRDAACIATADRFSGERIVAAVVLAPWADQACLDAPLRARFSPAVLPSRFVLVPEIPRTSTGKVLRPQLRSELVGMPDL